MDVDEIMGQCHCGSGGKVGCIVIRGLLVCVLCSVKMSWGKTLNHKLLQCVCVCVVTS